MKAALRLLGDLAMMIPVFVLLLIAAGLFAICDAVKNAPEMPQDWNEEDDE